MSVAIVHRHTPTLQVCDPSGAPVRSVAYYRRTAQEQAQPRVTASASRRAGRVSQQWDSRLFALSTALTADTANLTGLSSLSGRPLLTESVDAGWRVQFWGAAGELQVGWDGRGTRTRHTYDAMQRPIAVFEQCQDAPECCIGLTTYGTQAAASVALNQCGQPVRVDDSAGSRQVHGYSLQGAPLAETRHFLQALAEPDWPQAVAQRDALLEPEGATTRWGYDALGALLQQTDAQGNHQYTDYNIAGQIAGTRLQLRGQVEQTLIRDIAYNAFGQITAETAGNGVTTQATYRADTGVLLGLRAQRADKTWLQDLRYTYDPVGNVLSITDATQSVRHFANARIVPVNNYAYDTLSQLIRATGREVGSSGYGPELRVSADPTQLVNYTQTYHYDTAGNLHTLQHLGAQSYTRKMQAAEHSNRSLARKVNDPLLNAGEFSAGFDANGNVQHLQPGQVLLWDGRNQLCQVTPVARDEGADDTERYVYDEGGQRLRKVRISQAKNVAHIAQVRYLPGLEIREDSATGEILHVITAQSPGRSSVRVLHWVTDTPIGVSNNQLRYGLGDHLGSSSLELDSEAQLVSQEGYYPYGGTAWWAASNRTEVKYKTVRYSGKERDATGLYYYGFRYYAPCWGRWLNPDPAGTVDGLNLFRMVRNNPLTLIDDQGLSPTNPKEGVLYAPFVAPDILVQSLGRNLVRQSSGKSLQPLIVPDDSSRDELEQLRESLIDKYSEKINKLTAVFNSLASKGCSLELIRANFGPEAFDGMMANHGAISLQVNILKSMEVRSNSGGQALSALSPGTNKIYILGHGGAGMDVLAADQEMKLGHITSSGLARQLSDGGLPKYFQDIRSTACFSADTRQPTSFAPEELDSAAKMMSGKKSHFFGLLGPRTPSKQSFAQSLSGALKKNGFSQAQVTGYHGAGVTFSRTGNYLRRIVGVPNIDLRSSKARRVFK